MNFSNSNDLNDLIKQAGQNTGIDPNSIKNNIDNGKLEDIMAKMKPADAQRFQNILSNPQLAQQMLKTPQAQMLIKKFMK